jgi:hypothetical protein
MKTFQSIDEIDTGVMKSYLFEAFEIDRKYEQVLHDYKGIRSGVDR